MRITDRKLRQIIREEIGRDLRETPLDDMTGYSRGKTGKNLGLGPSVGHNVKNPNFVEDVRRLMTKTGDRWVIITVDEIEGIEDEVKTKRFRRWLESRRFSPKAKVIVVGAMAYDFDFESPEWILHDIIGHSAGKAFLDDLGFTKGAGVWLNQAEGRMQLVHRIHTLLRDSGAPVSGTEDPFDMIYDIFASIILLDISLETALSVVDDNEENRALVLDMFAAAQRWVDSIPSDGTRATIVKPW